MITTMIDVGDENFQSEVIESDLPVMVDFWADWSRPCLALAPVIEEIARERAGRIKVCRANINLVPDLATRFNIRNIPFIAFIKNGQKIGEVIGAQSKQTIMKAVDAVLEP